MHLVVREHERIPVVAERHHPTERALTHAESEVLLRVCERQGIAAVSGAYRAVKFSSFCGVIQAGHLLVEVLPKIAQAENFDRALLLRMIALAHRLPVAGLDADQLVLQQHCMLMVLVRWFCDELTEQLHRGLLRGYVTDEAGLPTIRGRWRPQLDALRHAGRPDRMHCEFDELTANNAYNQALKAALQRVLPLARGSQELTRMATQLLASMSEVDTRVVHAGHLDALPSNRLTQRYSRALMMARWFLFDDAPDLRRGRAEGVALLFDMNLLFQRTLAALIRRVLPNDLELREEKPRRYLATDGLGQQQFQMRPDLCILRDGEVLAIADAKWKLLNTDHASGHLGVSHADAYQLHAYAISYRCQRVALWYPGTESAEVSALPATVFTLPSHAEPVEGRELQVQRLFLGSAGSSAAWMAAMTAQVSELLAALTGEATA